MKAQLKMMKKTKTHDMDDEAKKLLELGISLKEQAITTWFEEAAAKVSYVFKYYYTFDHLCTLPFM